MSSSHSSNRHAGYHFVAPRFVPWALSLAGLIVPIIRRLAGGIVRIEIDPADLAALDALRKQRVILAPNHPSYEPLVLHWLGRKLGLDFAWMTARELFETWYENWLVSRTGAFSLDRGVHDEQSLKAARQILVNGEHWLVLFPEGQDYYLHDTIMPFLPGAPRLGLEALEMLREKGDDSPVYIVPVALRYYYLRDMRRAIFGKLRRLESWLGIGRAGPDLYRRAPLLERLAKIGERVLRANEALYNLRPAPGAALQERLDCFEEAVLRHVSLVLGTELPDPALPLRNRLRKLLNETNELYFGESSLPGAYGQRVVEQRRRQALRLREQLNHLLRFVALSADYVNERPTVERYLDILGRFEAELFEHVRYAPPRAARIQIGRPIELSSLLPHWRSEGEDYAEKLAADIEEAVREMLERSSDLMTELPE